MTPEDKPTSKSLKAGGEDNVTNLKALKGAAFDKAYVDHEVAYHQAVLDAVDKTLIPEREERGAEGAARQGASGVRRAPRAREARPGLARQVRRRHPLPSAATAYRARGTPLRGNLAAGPLRLQHHVPGSDAPVSLSADERSGIRPVRVRKKQDRFPQLLGGIALMVYPYFVSTVTWTVAIGAAIVAAVWLAVRQGW